MSCLFGCFRVKETQNPNHVVLSPIDEPVVEVSVSRKNKNALSSLFLSDDGELLGKAEKVCDSLPVELDFRELKNEAKFLKSCGTIPETPVEIRKGSEKWDDISAKNGDGDFSKFNLAKLSNESPTPLKICKESESAADSLDETTPSSCMTDGLGSRRVSISSALTSDVKNVITYADEHDTETSSATSSGSAVVCAPRVQGNNNSVRFDCNFDESALPSNDSSSKGAIQGFKLLPKPTPLILIEDVQKPGTVFPACTSNTNVSQYIYPDQNDYEKNDSEWKDLKTKKSASDCAIESPILSDVSLSKQDGYEEQFGSFLGENLLNGRTPGDRPILGMVAAHWKDDGSDQPSPVVWDGNGIPNLTNKYKEDQKVSWHATPFEERLEKALSEGSFASQRNQKNGTPPVEFNETEESDTAISHLQSPAHFKSVVSF